jgi:DNA-binding transcriptional regulator YiaG
LSFIQNSFIGSISVINPKGMTMKVSYSRKLMQAIPDASKHVIGPETLKRARAAFNETQGQFATRIGIRQSTLSRWENGQLPKRGSAALLLRRVMDDIARVHPVIR